MIGKGKSIGAMLLAAVMLFSGGCGQQEALKTVTAVPEEQKLILYTSHKEEVYGPIVKEFEERTGIWVQVVAGGTTELLERILAEGGENSCDVMFGGGVESYDAYRECFEPYQCGQAELLDATYVSEDGIWTVFSELPIVFIYNNKLVDKKEAPQGWADLLEEKWRGKIAFADAAKSGTSYTALATMIQVLDMDEKELLQKFAGALNGKVSEGSRAVVDEVASGVRLVGITLEETAKKRIAAGSDIAMVYPKEGTSAVPDGCALVKGARHVENAQLFIDFTVSNDVQRLLMEQFCRRTVRTDMQQETDADPARIAAFDIEWAGEHQEEILAEWSLLLEGEG